MTGFSSLDQRLVNLLLEGGVLRDIDPVRLRDRKLVIVPCADGKYIFELLLHHLKMSKKFWRLFLGLFSRRFHLEDVLFHTLALNGGALLLAPDSTAINIHAPEDAVLLHHLQQAVRIKHLDEPTVALYAHVPCGAATACGFNIVDQMKLTTQAKRRIKEIHPAWKVMCLMYVDYGNGRGCRSYIFSIREFEDWYAKNQKFVSRMAEAAARD